MGKHLPKPDCCTFAGCGRPHYRRGFCRAHHDRQEQYGSPDGGRASVKGDKIRWLEAHKDYAGNDCLTYPLFRDTKGYGQVRWNRKTTGAHRVMCELAHGLPPTSRHEAAHTCGNGHLGCVNPQHLRWATTKENAADKRAHGTIARGERMGSAKLSEASVRDIRCSTEIAPRLAEKYGVETSSIYAVRSRKTWRHVA